MRSRVRDCETVAATPPHRRPRIDGTANPHRCKSASLVARRHRASGRHGRSAECRDEQKGAYSSHPVSRLEECRRRQRPAEHLCHALREVVRQIGIEQGTGAVVIECVDIRGEPAFVLWVALEGTVRPPNVRTVSLAGANNDQPPSLRDGSPPRSSSRKAYWRPTRPHRLDGGGQPIARGLW